MLHKEEDKMAKTKKRVDVEPKVGSQEWLDEMTEQHGKLLKMDDFDDCIIGVVCRHTTPPFLLYDREKVIRKLMRRDGMTRERAVEFHDFNQACAWVGNATPGFLDR